MNRKQEPGGTGRDEPRHPIRVVAERTGLTPDVLRAWEKRYGVVRPVRTETGQRLYSDADIARLLVLLRVTESGRSIGQVAGLGVAELERLVAEDEASRVARDRERLRGAGEEASEQLAEALAAVRRMEPWRLESLLERAAVRLGLSVFLARVLVPLLHEVGELWHAGQIGVSHEHLASSAAERVLGWLQRTSEQATGPVIVIGTPAGQRHALGAMLSAAVAADAGWRVAYLGADLPASEVARAAKELDASAVALSLVYPAGSSEVAEELRRLRRLLPGTLLLVGGSGAESYATVLREIRARYLRDFEMLRSELSALTNGRSSAESSPA